MSIFKHLYKTSNIQPQTILPNEIIKLIFNYLDKEDLIKTRFTSHQFYQIASTIIDPFLLEFKKSCDKIIDVINKSYYKYSTPAFIGYHCNMTDKIKFRINFDYLYTETLFPNKELINVNILYTDTDNWTYHGLSSIVFVDQIETYEGYIIHTSCSSKIELIENNMIRPELKRAEKYILKIANSRR